jgi:hypothetical protein
MLHALNTPMLKLERLELRSVAFWSLAFLPDAVLGTLAPATGSQAGGKLTITLCPYMDVPHFGSGLFSQNQVCAVMRVAGWTSCMQIIMQITAHDPFCAGTPCHAPGDWAQGSGPWLCTACTFLVFCLRN